MLTSVLALVSALSPATSPDALWLRDYARGQEQAVRARRPLAVVVGRGVDGFDRLAQEGNLGDEVQKILADNYVCVYLDLNDVGKQKLVADLAIRNGGGLIISDRKGEVMAFHHDGTLSRVDLASYLRRFADPTLAVSTTQTHNTARYSYYPSGATTGSRPATVNC